jgi:hypothetical protein
MAFRSLVTRDKSNPILDLSTHLNQERSFYPERSMFIEHTKTPSNKYEEEFFNPKPSSTSTNEVYTFEPLSSMILSESDTTPQQNEELTDAILNYHSAYHEDNNYQTLLNLISDGVQPHMQDLVLSLQTGADTLLLLQNYQPTLKEWNQLLKVAVIFGVTDVINFIIGQIGSLPPISEFINDINISQFPNVILSKYRLGKDDLLELTSIGNIGGILYILESGLLNYQSEINTVNLHRIMQVLTNNLKVDTYSHACQYWLKRIKGKLTTFNQQDAIKYNDTQALSVLINEHQLTEPLHIVAHILMQYKRYQPVKEYILQQAFASDNLQGIYNMAIASQAPVAFLKFIEHHQPDVTIVTEAIPANAAVINHLLERNPDILQSILNSLKIIYNPKLTKDLLNIGASVTKKAVTNALLTNNLATLELILKHASVSLPYSDPHLTLQQLQLLLNTHMIPITEELIEDHQDVQAIVDYLTTLKQQQRKQSQTQKDIQASKIFLDNYKQFIKSPSMQKEQELLRELKGISKLFLNIHTPLPQVPNNYYPLASALQNIPIYYTGLKL